MSVPELISCLERFPPQLRGVVDPLDADTWRWKPDSSRWSVLQIVAHLADEETEDFRKRLDLTLHHPQTPWPPIDPESWARDRDYDSAKPENVLSRFCAERESSLRWLRSLNKPDWSTFRSHPKAGKISAGDLLASWARHDLLHLRQITTRLTEHTAAQAHPFSGRYAGS